jgi:hypothetical protein
MPAGRGNKPMRYEIEKTGDGVVEPAMKMWRCCTGASSSNPSSAAAAPEATYIP